MRAARLTPLGVGGARRFLRPQLETCALQANEAIQLLGAQSVVAYNPQALLDKAYDGPNVFRHGGDRPTAIATAFQTAGARVAGIQEARGKVGSLNCGHYYFVSGPTHGGNRGVQLRFKLDLLYA